MHNFCRAKVASSFQQLRNSGDIAATMFYSLYTRDIEIASSCATKIARGNGPLEGVTNKMHAHKPHVKSVVHMALDTLFCDTSPGSFIIFKISRCLRCTFGTSNFYLLDCLHSVFPIFHRCSELITRYILRFLLFIEYIYTKS